MIKPLLEGIRVLVCRAKPQADELCKVMSSVGANTRAMPCIDIVPREINGATRSLILDLDQFSKIIVVSQHAAKLMLTQLDEYWPQPPAHQSWFAIGRASSQILHDYGLALHAPQKDLTSEALLDSPELQNVKGEKLLIAKGHGGRSKLEQGLRDRGAKVSTIELYERIKPQYEEEFLRASLNDFAPDYVVALSSETADNLKQFANQVQFDMHGTCVIVPSKRVAGHAVSIGLPNTLICEQLKPIDLIKAIRQAANRSKH